MELQQFIKVSLTVTSVLLAYAYWREYGKGLVQSFYAWRYTRIRRAYYLEVARKGATMRSFDLSAKARKLNQLAGNKGYL